MSKILKIEPLGFPWKTQDPFLFCAYHRDVYPAGNERMEVPEMHLKGRSIGQDFTLKEGWRMYHGRKIPGFPYHPHRGFETITINKEGVVDHSDSLGASGRFMAGDIQWMTAGSGIQHSEMFPLLNQDQQNPLEIFQIWLNLPKIAKMTDPHFKMLWRQDVPVYHHEDSSGKTTTAQIIVGELYGMKALTPTPNSWAADPDNAVGVYTVTMEPGAQWALPETSKEANRTVFFYKGDTLQIATNSIAVNHLIALKAAKSIEIENGESEARLLILEGKPINEPVVQHGPFVMNSAEEIREAMKDYGETQFGGWPWAETEVVHSKNRGRFAHHNDGREEIPS